MVKTHRSNNVHDILKHIKIFITDVDGVLTDGSMYYSVHGEELKRFNTKDGMGFELLKKNSIIPVILTKEKSEIVLKRAEKLKITNVYIGIEDKLEKATEIAKKYQISLDEVLFIGDDINDIQLLKCAGFSCCPQDGVDDVKKVVHYVCLKSGGDGAVREVVEMVLKARLPLNS